VERALAVVGAVLLVLVVGTVGAGIGFVYLTTDPALQAQRGCGGCTHFTITSRTADRVEFTYDQPDGSHCQGYEEVRHGFLGLPTAGSGGSVCAPAGQPLPVPGAAPPPATPFPDGNPGCVKLQVKGPVARSGGFEVVVTNLGTATCDIDGLAKVLYLDPSGTPLDVASAPAGEAVAPVALKTGASAAFDFDYGGGPCQTPARFVFIMAAAAPQLPSPGLVCAPVVEHPAYALA
jgi:hypothetical protein